MNNNFGEFLYTLRKEKGMTQAELADKLGVSNKAVSKWETGDAMPETSLLLPISRIFGVSVDELLSGERTATVSESEPEIIDSERDGDNIENNGEDKTENSTAIDRHIFTRGKDDNKTLLDKICGAVCASVMLIGVALYIFLGCFADLWDPYWVLVVVCGLSCGIISCIFDICNKQKREKKYARGENPIFGSVCGIVILSCVAIYIVISAFTGLWHPLWFIVVGGALACGIISTVGAITVHNKHKD